MATASSSLEPQTAGKYLDLDQTPIQGQTGWALLDLHGNVLVLSDGMTESNVSILYQMLLETSSLHESDFRKLTVSFSTSQYLVSRDEQYIYLVEKSMK